MPDQLTFDFSAPKESDPVEPVDVCGPVDSAGHLRQLVEDGEYMIYLYGENPHMCFVRTHSSNDDGTIYPIVRKVARPIMGNSYVHHCNHISHDNKRARVYLRRGLKWKKR